MRMPESCDAYGCGELFTVSHASDCRKGCLVTQQYNEVRNALGDKATVVHSKFLRKPV